MASRDMFKIIEKCKMNPLYQMNSGEIEELYRFIMWNREYEAIAYGYALGRRALKAELKKGRKRQGC